MLHKYYFHILPISLLILQSNVIQPEILKAPLNQSRRSELYNAFRFLPQLTISICRCGLKEKILSTVSKITLLSHIDRKVCLHQPHLNLPEAHRASNWWMSAYTGLFISPSGTSELDCAATKKDRAERSISIGTESLKVFFCTRGLGVLAGSTARG